MQITLDPRFITFGFSRSSGPGGQNVNKVNTRVTVFFDLAQCTDLSDAQKTRIRNKLATRCSQAGVVRVASQKHRTQLENRQAALARFQELIEEALTRPKTRVKTRVSKSVKQKRLDLKKQRGRLKRERTRSEWD
ncbi:MAG: aminoacyl-tRNA hydrolase [Phycisphaeraceae bacterium]|nr:aminoacyl-tRNA hydrolase [Phycisphaeraceae bacterium]